jgi:TPR repeat protein
MFTLKIKDKKLYKEKLKEQLDNCKSTKYKSVLEKGTSDEQYNMAECLIKGSGFFMKETMKMTETLLKKAADNGHVEASYKFYILLSMENKKVGLKYLKFAAEKGHAGANKSLISCYLYGDSICKSELDPQKGFEILEKLVKRKDEMAYLMIARCYERGVAVPVDLEKAKIYYNKSKYILKQFAINRVDFLIKIRDNPSKELREEFIKKYPYGYKIIKDKLVPANNLLL